MLSVALLLLCLCQDPAPDRLTRLETELSALRQELITTRSADRARYEAQIAALALELEDERRAKSASSAGGERLIWEKIVNAVSDAMINGCRPSQVKSKDWYS